MNECQPCYTDNTDLHSLSMGHSSAVTALTYKANSIGKTNKHKRASERAVRHMREMATADTHVPTPKPPQINFICFLDQRANTHKSAVSICESAKWHNSSKASATTVREQHARKIVQHSILRLPHLGTRTASTTIGNQPTPQMTSIRLPWTPGPP